jgi:hypothetical protein
MHVRLPKVGPTTPRCLATAIRQEDSGDCIASIAALKRHIPTLYDSTLPKGEMSATALAGSVHPAEIPS